MVAGNWLNYDGLYLQYGTQKAVPEIGGDYLAYGDTRVFEVLIPLGQTVFGTPTGNVAVGPLPSSFQGTIASQSATANTGIVSYTTLFPLQPTTPISILASSGVYTASVGAASGILNIINPTMFIEQIDFITLVPAGQGATGTATGLTGVGLVIPVSNQSAGPTAPSWAQVTPNTGLQLMGAILTAQMVPSSSVPGRWTFYPGLSGGTAQMSVLEGYSTSGTAVTTVPGAPQWLGNVPLTTLSETYLPGGLPNNAYVSAIASGGPFTGANGGGLMKLRVHYNWYGTINDANQI